MGMTRQRELPVTDMAESRAGIVENTPFENFHQKRKFICKYSISIRKYNTFHNGSFPLFLSETNELMERENLLSRYGTAAERVEPQKASAKAAESCWLTMKTERTKAI